MTNLPVFSAAMFLLFITPGPDMLHLIARSIGLAELLRTVPAAYNAVRDAGAAYLISWLPDPALARGTGGDAIATAPSGLPRVFAKAAITNILNPKIALFILPLPPQFIVRNGSAFGQTVRLGFSWAWACGWLPVTPDLHAVLIPRSKS